MYKLMTESDRIYRAISAHEFPTRGERMMGFKAKAKELRSMLLAYSKSIAELDFWLVYEDGSRQLAYFVGQHRGDVIFVCDLDEELERR